MPLAGPVKGKIVFHDHDYGVGWTETIYVNEVNSLPNAAITLNALVKARVALLANNITVDNVTVSVDSPLQLGDVAYGTAYGYVQNKVLANIAPGGFANYEPDFAWTAQLVRLHAGTLYHRSIWLSGVPDNLTLDNIGQITDPQWVQAFQQWVKVITNGNYMLYAASKDAGTSPIYQVVGVSLDGTQITVAPDLPGPIGQTVFVHGIKGKSNPVGSVPLKLIRPTGRFGVSLINGAQVTIVRKPNVDSFVYTTGGYMRPVVYQVFGIDSATIGALRKKSRGRPLGLARGRSPARYRI
jgi:hypothetical protein